MTPTNKEINMPGKRWNEDEDTYLINNRQDMTAKEMSSHLPGRTSHSVEIRISHLGLTQECMPTKKIPNMTPDQMKNFWSRVDIGDRGSCWRWKRGCTKDGYGSLGINGKVYRAPRISFSLYYGPIPDGKIILHKCDNPLCCNPHHLEFGTKKDNSKNKYDRGRGNNYRKFNFTDADVEQMLMWRQEKWTYEEISQKFGCSANTISTKLKSKIHDHNTR